MRSYAPPHTLIALFISVFLPVVLCAPGPIYTPNHRRDVGHESERTGNWLSLYADHLGNDHADSDSRRPSHVAHHDNDDDYANDLWGAELLVGSGSSERRPRRRRLRRQQNPSNAPESSDSGSAVSRVSTRTTYTSPYLTTFTSRPPSSSFAPLAEISELFGMRVPLRGWLSHLVWERVPEWWESMRVRLMRPIGGEGDSSTSDYLGEASSTEGPGVVRWREDDVFLLRAMEKSTFMRMDDLPPELVLRRAPAAGSGGSGGGVSEYHDI